MLGSAHCHARDHNRAKQSASHRLAQLLLPSPAWSDSQLAERIYGEHDFEVHFLMGILIHSGDSNLLDQFIKSFIQ